MPDEVWEWRHITSERWPVYEPHGQFRVNRWLNRIYGNPPLAWQSAKQLDESVRAAMARQLLDEYPRLELRRVQ